MLIERHPIAAMRWISATDSSTSKNGMMPIGMNRPGWASGTSPTTQSLKALHAARDSFLSGRLARWVPAKPGKVANRVAARVPLASMSRTRRSMS